MGIERDLIYSVGRTRTAKVLISILNVIQDMTKEEQVVAAACLFMLLQRRFKSEMSVSELLSLAERVMMDAEGYRTEFAAAGDYLKYEL